MLKVIFMLLIWFFPVANVMAAEVVLCRSLKLINRTNCVVKHNSTKAIKKNNQVVIHNEKGSWVATGKVKLVTKLHFVTTFPGKFPIKKGDKARVVPFDEESIINYEAAFE